MINPIERFRENINRARHFYNMYVSLEKSTTNIVDVSDILRAEIVMGVSALDNYVHEVVRVGMVQIFEGERQKTEMYKKFEIPLDHIPKVEDEEKGYRWFELLVKNKNSHKTFQNPNKINSAIRLVLDVNNIWDEIARETKGSTGKELRNRMSLIVDRRNKIAHESDRDRSKQTGRWPIDQHMVEDSLDFIDWSVEKIDSKISLKKDRM